MNYRIFVYLFLTADAEYEAFLIRAGLAERELVRHRLEAEPLPEIRLEDWSGIMVGGRAKGFVNGVLRNLIRNKTRLFDISNGSFRNEKEVLATRFSIPLPVVHYYFEAYGKEAAPAILAQMNVPAPLSVRVNTLKLSREDLAAKLQAEGLVHIYIPYYFLLLITGKIINPIYVTS